MLTRLKIRGFKNLADVDVSFGPFTCIAGANGVGKSNLFDAITFLSALTDHPFMEAAKSVRDERHRSTDVRSLFLKRGRGHVEEICFEAEMLVSPTGQDDLGQMAEAAFTFLRYALVLRYRKDAKAPSPERLEIVKEELGYIRKGDSARHLPFPRSSEWLKSVVKGERRTPFLSTHGTGKERRIKLHQDGRSGRPREYSAAELPRTVLSSTNAIESPTALLARREMQSWRLLQLEPSSLRNSDSFNAPTHVGIDGSHLAATLYHLAGRKTNNGRAKSDPEAVYATVANELSALVDDVHDVRVDVNKQRELLTIEVVDRSRNKHAARALSDGTLRFLALAILKMDPDAKGLVCFEEPENGIHPERILAMLKLLQNFCVDSDDAVGEDNPLRQVIVNTHSPAVVSLVHDGDLLVAQPREVNIDHEQCRAVAFSWLPDTWRHKAAAEVRTVSRGVLSAYLNPLAIAEEPEDSGHEIPASRSRKRCRVKDRKDMHPLLPFMKDE